VTTADLDEDRLWSMDPIWQHGPDVVADWPDFNWPRADVSLSQLQAYWHAVGHSAADDLWWATREWGKSRGTVALGERFGDLTISSAESTDDGVEIGFRAAAPSAADPTVFAAAVGISSAVKASTHEGKGRYLVANVSSPLDGEAEARIVTIQLVKPTQPLPEKRSTQTTQMGAITGGALTRAGMPKGIADAIEEAEHIAAQEYPYATPGARGTPPPAIGPYDCSGSTSRIVYVACGQPTTTLASEELSKFGEAGEGQWITIYAKGPNGPSGHAFCKLKTAHGWRFFGTSSSTPNEGAGWVDASEYSAEYLAEFQVRHPAGL
jgi:hypothetical protein